AAIHQAVRARAVPLAVEEVVDLDGEDDGELAVVDDLSRLERRGDDPEPAGRWISGAEARAGLQPALLVDEALEVVGGVDLLIDRRHRMAALRLPLGRRDRGQTQRFVGDR